MATLFPFPSSKALVRALSSANSANWIEVPGDKGLASMVSKLETTAYLAFLFPSKTKLLTSVYQISSGFVRGSSDNLSQSFVQWSKVSRQEWKGREPFGVGRRLAGLKTSQGDVVKPGLSISTTWYLKMASPIQELFHLVVDKNSLPPGESFKASSVRTAIAARFQKQERSLPSKGVGHSGTTRNWWKNICPSHPFTQEILGWIFCNCFSSSTQNGKFGRRRLWSRRSGQSR